MFHPFAGFPPHFEEYSTLYGIGGKMVVAAIGLMYGTPVVNFKKRLAIWFHHTFLMASNNFCAVVLNK
jgi:hypothetical protein